MHAQDAPFQPAAAAAGTKAAASEVTARVRFDQIQSHFQLTPQPVMAGMVFAALLAWAVVPTAGPVVAAWWLAGKLVFAAARLAQTRLFSGDAARRQHAERWYWRYYVLMLLDSIAWGLIGALFMPSGVVPLDTVLVAAVLGVAASGVFTLIGNVFSSASFLALVLTPTFVQFVSSSERWSWLGGLGVAIYFAVMVFESWRGERLFLQITRLRRENEWIAEERRQALVLAEQGSAAKTRFLATVSHEVRTPLNGILGMTQLLQQTLLDATQRQQLEVVAQSARHLRTIIDDILDMARIESGRVNLMSAPFHLAQTVGEVTAVLAPLAQDKGLVFSTQLDSSLASHWVGDAARIRQVLHNLLGNAIKFTMHGGVSLSVSPAAAGLRFVVSDTGPGVLPHAQRRIFEPFERAGHDAAPAGTGLGLSISRQLARAMAGDVHCAASSAAGSSFAFDLASEAAPAPLGENASAPSAAPARASGPVLLVEDNPVNAIVAGAMLERLGLVYEHVDSGEKALARLSGAGFALVLMDCQMPGIDGLEATRRWRAIEAAEPRRGRTPVVAVTANATASDRQRCLAAGMDDYLSKPFEIAVFGEVVARHLGPTPTR